MPLHAVALAIAAFAAARGATELEAQVAAVAETKLGAFAAALVELGAASGAWAGDAAPPLL